MGYYKNLEVAEQLEVPERVPRPKPAIEHAVFFPNRKLRRMSEMKPRRNLAWIGWILIGIAVGIAVGVFI